MINQSEIRRRYSRMEDEELITLCNTEGVKLTGEAIQVLEAEFIKRNLNMQLIERLKIGAVLQHDQSIHKLRESSTELFVESIWKYVLEQKKKGITNQEVFDGLLLKGLDEETALIVIQDLEPRVMRVREIYKTEMNTGWLLSAIGVVGFLLVRANEGTGTLYLFSIFLICIGAIRGINGFLKMDTFRTILKNIRDENSNTWDN